MGCLLRFRNIQNDCLISSLLIKSSGLVFLTKSWVTRILIVPFAIFNRFQSIPNLNNHPPSPPPPSQLPIQRLRSHGPQRCSRRPFLRYNSTRTLRSRAAIRALGDLVTHFQYLANGAAARRARNHQPYPDVSENWFGW